MKNDKEITDYITKHPSRQKHKNSVVPAIRLTF